VPFIVIASSNAAGAMDTSPKGDPPGFVKVLDKHTLAIPDRLGNHRGDTFLNVLENPSVGIIFIVPKRREVVRVSGTASLARDPDLLAEMTINGKSPDLAMIVRVREALFHCGKSMIRSGMWEPDRWGSIEGLPSYAQALKDHGAFGRLSGVVAGARGAQRNATPLLKIPGSHANDAKGQDATSRAGRRSIVASSKSLA
jgi:uncharacterized protein